MIGNNSLVTLFTRDPPTIAGYTFDAILEDELEFSVQVPSYPIESGAEVSDHRIINPCRYRIVGLMTNTPLQQSLLGFAGSMAGGLVSNLTSNPLVAAVAGLSAGFLASSDGTRASAALANLIAILEGAKPFDVVAGDITLKNMVAVRLTRRKTPENENGLEFVLELQEFIELERLTASGQPSHDQMQEGSPEQSSCAKAVEKGLTSVKEAGASAVAKVKDVVSGGIDAVKGVFAGGGGEAV